MRRRALLYAALALCVPLPALAALAPEGEDAPAATPASLAVSVALDGCSAAGSAVACRLAIDYETLPDATTYTASVSRPDGSVVDLGTVGAGSASVWVGYVGDGVYTVEVSAYGDPEQPGAAASLLNREVAEATPTVAPQARERAVPRPAASAPGPDADGAKPGPADAGQALSEPDSPEGEQGKGMDAGGEQGGKPPAPSCPDREPDEARYDPGDASHDCRGTLGSGS